MEENTQPAVENKPEPKPIKVQMIPKEPEVDRKTELMRKKAKDRDRLPPAEEKELQELLAAEALEKRKGALLHKLSERADKHGRKQVGDIKKKITDHVAVFGAEKNREVLQVTSRFNTAVKELDKATKKAMQDLQEAHNRALSELNREREQGLGEISKKYHSKFEEAELEMEGQIDEVANAVGDFQTVIQTLTLEQLEELEKNGVVSVTLNGKEGDFITVPGHHP